MRIIITVLLTILLQSFGSLLAQDEDKSEDFQQQLNALKPGQSRFLLRGYAHSGLEIYEEEASFVGGSFNPIFLWQQSDRLLFEGELEIELEDGTTIVGLEYANMAYIITNGLTLRLGKFLLPFGIFNERLHPRWINRLPSNPLGFTHDNQIGPASDLGAEIRGGLPLGSAKINYALYAVNGPTLNSGGDEPEEAGQLHYDNFDDNNLNKAFGGRLGFLPFSNSSVEVGFAGQYGKVGDHESEYEDIAATMYAADFSFVKSVRFLRSVVDLKGQWNWVNVDDADFISLENPNEPIAYTFKNQSQAYFGRASIKPAFIENRFIQNLEFAGRYSVQKTPDGALWEADRSEITIGLNYWLDWRTVFKIGLRIDTTEEDSHDEDVDTHLEKTSATASEGSQDHGAGGGNALLIHWSFGF